MDLHGHRRSPRSRRGFTAVGARNRVVCRLRTQLNRVAVEPGCKGGEFRWAFYVQPSFYSSPSPRLRHCWLERRFQSLVYPCAHGPPVTSERMMCWPRPDLMLTPEIHFTLEVFCWGWGSR